MHDFSDWFEDSRMIVRSLEVQTDRHDGVINFIITPHQTERPLTWEEIDTGVHNAIVEVFVLIRCTWIGREHALETGGQDVRAVKTCPFELDRVGLLKAFRVNLPTELGKLNDV